MKTVRPMLAEKAPSDRSKLSYPLLASPKLDGVRCLIKDGKPVSRTLKPIPNSHIQEVLSRPELEGLDGELIVGDPAAPGCLSRTVSGVMSEAGQPDFTFFVFDNWRREEQYSSWHYNFFRSLKSCGPRPYIEYLPQETQTSVWHLDQYIERQLDKGFEGVVTRSPDSLYKFGRSTLKQQWMLKIKERERSEALVVGTIPLLHNWNMPEINALGLTERTSHKDNKVEAAMLGALVCQTPEGVTFKVGTGFTLEQRERMWNDRDELIGLICSYEHSPYGIKQAPRNPSFIGFRNPIDM